MAKEGAAVFTVRINLLPEEHRRKERVRIPLPDLPVGKTIIVLFAVGLLAQLGLVGYSLYQQSRIQGLRREVEALTRETEQVARHKSEIVTMRERLSEIRTLTGRPLYWSRLLEALTVSTVKGTWLTSLAYQETQETPLAAAGQNAAGDKRGGGAKTVRSLRVQGSAVGQGQETAYIGKLIKEIKENPFFAGILSDVKLSTINQKKIREFDVYDFVLQCVFKDAEKKNVKA